MNNNPRRIFKNHTAPNALLPSNEEGERNEQVWTDDQSNVSSECTHSSCDSRTYEWSPFVEDNFLFYIKFDLVYQAKPIVFDDDLFFRNEYKRLSIRKKENILSKFGQHEKNKYKLFKVNIIDSAKKEHLNGINKEIVISIAPKKNVTLKEILPLTENILGITTTLFPDGRKLMVDKIKHFSVFCKGRLVKSKDWIKSIDAEPVTVDNLESMLESCTKIPTIIKITFFEMIEHDISNAIEIKITNLMDLIQNQETLFNKDDIQTMSSNDLVFSMIYISKEYTQNDELDIKFCYPTKENNLLFNSKAFNKPIEQQTELIQLCELIRHSIKTNRSMDKFEKTFHEPHFVPLPKEIQLRIDDALGELEAMDYRNWNDELVDLFCDLTIIGCCLYYNQHLICSHLSGAFLVEVEAILKNLGIFEVMSSTTLKNLAIWRKVYPAEYCEQKFHEKNDAYLMLVSIGHLLMVVILEAPINTNHNKSLSRYIEEIQDMLDYFKSTGIENLVRIWIDSNRRPQCISTLVIKQDSASEDQRSATRNHDEESNASSSIKNHILKDDSTNEHDDDDDSDWGQSLDSSQRSSTFDINEISENRCKEFSELIPSTLTFGSENLLYYFVQLEIGDGIFLAPVLSLQSAKHDLIINTFRKTCTIIHNTLQNTKKFRDILSNESSKIANTHSSLVVIKEQGMLMSALKEGSSNERIEFWVLGRLFSSPPRELYVCHRADAPQNMIELAFRICLTCAG